MLELDDSERIVDHGADDANRVSHDFSLDLGDADQAVRVVREVELFPVNRNKIIEELSLTKDFRGVV